GWGRLLSFDAFVAIWRAILLVTLVWLAGPLTLPVLLLLPVASEVNAGNIQILLAAAIVAGFRHPAAWAFPLLTKFTCGIGLLWFAVRREWRNLAVAVGVAAAIAVATFVLWPDRWTAYLGFVGVGAPNLPAEPPLQWPLAVRLPIAIGLAILAAVRGWRWLLVIASVVALPLFYIPSFAMLVGVLPYVRAWGGRRLIGLIPRPAGAPEVA
ncbi:MAG TPA: hypothetical protein VET90_08675, partial [Candidatus Binatus sp.]|nr:hypothetical protein [Candidatus Binatus sp.]